MVLNPNDIIADPEVRDLVQRTACRLKRRVPSSVYDADDIEQEINRRVLERLRSYQSDRGTVRAFVTVALVCVAATVARDLRAKKRSCRIRSLDDCVRTGEGHLSPLVELIKRDARRGTSRLSPEELADLAMDVGELVRSLPPEERDLAARLAVDSITAAAHATGQPRTTLYGVRERLAKRFEDKGLREYLE